MRVRSEIVLFWMPAADVIGSLKSPWLEVEYASSREAHCSHLTSRRLSNWKLSVPSSSSQVTLKFKSSAVHVLGSSVGQTEQSKFCRFTTAGWHSPQPQHFLSRSGWAKGSTLQFLKSEIKTWSILSDWLIFCCCKNPKADVETTSQVSWEDGLVVPLVYCPSEVSQIEGARWNTVDLCCYFGIFCSPATIACFPTSLVA